MFGRRRGFTFVRPKRDLTAIYSRATGAAGPAGTDSLDLLVAALAAGGVAKVIRRLDVDPAGVAASADAARLARDPKPGLTDDAKRVVETVSRRALERRRDASAADLLLALTVAETPAQAVLRASGIDEARLRALVE